MTSTDRLALSVRSLSSKGLSARKIARLLRISERRVFQLRSAALALSSLGNASETASGVA
ncbi:hypothetical protein A0U92_03530 [Acetobacter aceti]|uniref:Resolvase HTH domain-containing protein n=1 Tax=Acetobacter aceti TaxID=435 RepID=A0A1U9KDX6_ACEAC|nr:hypothetical protein A0U92_03530 [Acetobacter aceti]